MSRSADLAMWSALAATAVLLELMAMAGHLPSAADTITLVMRRRVGRWAVLLGWLWLGWHLFVR
jgi:hypothetical protein